MHIRTALAGRYFMASSDSGDSTDLFVEAMHGRARALADAERLAAGRLRHLQAAVREAVEGLSGIDSPRVKKCREKLRAALLANDASPNSRRN
jgi:hypothetical protein